mgnify:CR=1 FL=1
MDDSFLIRCTKCKGSFRDKVRRVQNGYSRQCPLCERVLFFDGVARHTQEGLDFVQRSNDVGFREAVRERDRPFGDYGERGRS